MPEPTPITSRASAASVSPMSGGGGVRTPRPPSSGSGGGGVPPTPDYVTRDAVSRMIGQSESRTVAALARLEATINQRLQHIPTTHVMIYVVVGAVISGVLGLLTILAFAGDRFDAGIALTSGTIQQSLDARKASEEQAKQFKEVMDYLKRKDEQPKQSKPIQ